MFRITSELTELPNMTLIKGIYKNRSFTISYFLNHEYRISGSFTDQEKESIIKAYLNQL